jgi:hypothetical protein
VEIHCDKGEGDDMELTPDAVAQYHAAQIYQIVTQTEQLQSPAWLAPIELAIKELEGGFLPAIFGKRRALQVANTATRWRQTQTSETNEWFIACIIESVATIRLMHLRHPDKIPDVDYNTARMLALSVGKKYGG